MSKDEKGKQPCQLFGCLHAKRTPLTFTPLTTSVSQRILGTKPKAVNNWQTQYIRVYLAHVGSGERYTQLREGGCGRRIGAGWHHSANRCL